MYNDKGKAFDVLLFNDLFEEDLNRAPEVDIIISQQGCKDAL